jgi:hypothetical protein
MVLQNLSEVLIIAYPLILIVLFWLPVLLQEEVLNRSSIIETSNIITKDNLSSRIPLPQNRDELYVLSKTINIYLTESKTQSKEKRTRLMLHMNWGPLTIIKGTLEVLIEAAKFFRVRGKINFCIYEVDRLNKWISCYCLRGSKIKSKAWRKKNLFKYSDIRFNFTIFSI